MGPGSAGNPAWRKGGGPQMGEQRPLPGGGELAGRGGLTSKVQGARRGLGRAGAGAGAGPHLRQPWGTCPHLGVSISESPAGRPTGLEPLTPRRPKGVAIALSHAGLCAGPSRVHPAGSPGRAQSHRHTREERGLRQSSEVTEPGLTSSPGPRSLQVQDTAPGDTGAHTQPHVPGRQCPSGHLPPGLSDLLSDPGSGLEPSGSSFEREPEVPRPL